MSLLVTDGPVDEFINELDDAQQYIADTADRHIVTSATATTPPNTTADLQITKRFTIPSFLSKTDIWRSQAFSFRNHQWQLSVHPMGNQNPETLAAYIDCISASSGDANDANDLFFQIRVINVLDANGHSENDDDHSFTHMDHDRGFVRLCKQATIRKPNSPFIDAQGGLTLEVHMCDAAIRSSLVDNLHISAQSSLFSRHDDSCSICTDPLSDTSAGAGGILRLACKHEFHRACLTPWLKRSKECPMCRTHIESRTQTSAVK
jgi:hypothetical protein